MKKIIAILMVFAMLASMMLFSVSAETENALKTFEEAEDGDLLWTVDFNNSEIFTPDYVHADVEANMDVTISDDGREATIKAKEGCANHFYGFWGGPIKGLNIDNSSQYTMVFKVRANGTIGKENSTGIYGFRYNNGIENELFSDNIHGLYGNWNSMGLGGLDLVNQSCLMFSWMKRGRGDYTQVADNAAEDWDRFITVKVEYNLADNIMKVAFLGADGSWIEDSSNSCGFEKLDEIPDEVVLVLYGYWNCVDATFKDIQYYKGVNLFNAPEVTTPEVSTTPEEITTPEGTTDSQKPADSTNDHSSAEPAEPASQNTVFLVIGIIAAVVVVAVVVVVVIKKKAA